MTLLPCGCCEGITAETPDPIGNRAGLTAIAYRAGTWAQFKASMLDAISTFPELAGLTTRDDADFSIALLDSWAVVCDIVTFYEERIANESYLRTATERLSLSELAKLIGYKLAPGLAATAAMAFTIDAPVALPPGPSSPPSGAPSSVVLPEGTQVQSVPDPGVQPAIFETLEAVEARAEWNAMVPRRWFTRSSHNALRPVRLAAQPAVRPGDSLLLQFGQFSGDLVTARVTDAVPDQASQTALISFEQQTGAVEKAAPVPNATPSPGPGPLDDEFLWANVKGRAWTDQTELVALAQARRWSVDALEDEINTLNGVERPGSMPPVQVWAMGVKASLFGASAPQYDTIPAQLRFGETITIGKQVRHVAAAFPTSWENATVAGRQAGLDVHIDLDQVYPTITAGCWIVLSDEKTTSVVPAKGVEELTVNGFLMTATVTRVWLDCRLPAVGGFGLRTTRVYASTAKLTTADVFSTDPVEGPHVTLDRAYLSLRPGQLVAVTGVSASQAGKTVSEVAQIHSVGLVDGYTKLTLSPALSNRYQPGTVTIDANVAPASHGQTRSEILGSGDGSQTFQRFALQQTPLTYLSAQNPRGSASTLQIRVNGVTWTEVPWLYGAGPHDRVFTVVAGADAKTYVQFGDGVTGARLPTGSANVVAAYRQGIGTPGLVRAGQLSTLLSRPLGLKAATNPLSSTGAGDPETLEQARLDAPVSVRTLGRIVTLEDFGDFARASAGIAKAGASWVWDGQRDVACVTVAGIEGAPVMPGSTLHTNLLATMRASSDGVVPVQLCPASAITFTVAAVVMFDPALQASDVVAAVSAALRAAFSFDTRQFAQPVYRSEVVAVIQNVPGVIDLTLDAFGYSGKPPSHPQPDVLVSKAPTNGSSGMVGAELLTLDPGPIPGLTGKPGPMPVAPVVAS